MVISPTFISSVKINPNAAGTSATAKLFNKLNIKSVGGVKAMNFTGKFNQFISILNSSKDAVYQNKKVIFNSAITYYDEKCNGARLL